MIETQRNKYAQKTPVSHLHMFAKNFTAPAPDSGSILAPATVQDLNTSPRHTVGQSREQRWVENLGVGLLFLLLQVFRLQGTFQLKHTFSGMHTAMSKTTSQCITIAHGDL